MIGIYCIKSAISRNSQYPQIPEETGRPYVICLGTPRCMNWPLLMSSCVTTFSFPYIPEHPVSPSVQKFLVVLAFLLVPGPKTKLQFNQFLQRYIIIVFSYSIFHITTKSSWMLMEAQIKVSGPTLSQLSHINQAACVPEAPLAHSLQTLSI